MSTPLSPKGSPLEQAAKNDSLAAKVTLIALAHIAVLAGGLVFYGCSRETPTGSTPPGGAGAGTTQTPPAPTYTPPSEPVSPAPYTDTNAIVAPVVSSAPSGKSPAPAPTTTPQTAPTPSLHPTAFEPALTPTPGAATTAAGPTEYKVQKGDIGTTIAKNHNVTVADLKAANPAVNWTKLKVDQVIQIPAPSPLSAATESKADATTEAITPDGLTVHTVKPHETLVSIGKKYGVSWKRIRAANGLKSENIKVGDKLKIPAKSTGARPAAASPVGGTPASEPSAQPLPTGRQP